MSNSSSNHAHVDVLGVKVSAVNLQVALSDAEQWIASGRPGFICVTGVHGVMEARSDATLRQFMNQAVLNVPDGMPLTWIGRLYGYSDMGRVFGPDLMLALCKTAAHRGYRVFLYGGKPGVAQELKAKLQNEARGLQVVGVYTPPFGPLDAKHEQEVLAQIHKCKPHIVWVGLSTPKQERFMAQYVERFQVPLMVGVGAAFDFHTGRIRDCPGWIKRAGLQWLHRLIQDPKRLWRRYLTNNPAFVWHITRQIVTHVRVGRDTRS
jgi:N-acetylglucosaminyldiphosphoundecaprenol N-acetyl-beta-D-mannosaminyltransferase